MGHPPTLPLPIRERRGRARKAALSTAARRFRRRAQLYGALDARLHSRTRFFGAACLTNRVLGHLTSFGGALADADLCAGWLWDLGASLETVNRSIAEAVHTGRLAGPALDQRIVSIEQSAVERSLQSAKGARGNAHLEVLPALDVILNHQSWISTLHFSAAVRWYRRVLAEVRHDLQSPIEFARQLHREKIGMALIAALRRDELSRGALRP
jgi:hypothetical protein